MLLELIKDNLLDKLLTLNPVEEAPHISWPNCELVLCPREAVCPKVEPVCPIIGVDDCNNEDGWVLLPNAGFVAWDGPELKKDDAEANIDGDE